jgi:hypothetical protein
VETLKNHFAAHTNPSNKGFLARTEKLLAEKHHSQAATQEKETSKRAMVLGRKNGERKFNRVPV